MSGSAGRGQRSRLAPVVIVLALVVVAAMLSRAGSNARPLAGDRIRGTTLTIYTSLPLQGASAAGAQAALAGERLALGQAHGRIGRYRIVLKALDDSTLQRAGWDPGQTTVNARQAVADPSTIAYLGELNSGASAISIPILNRAGIAQISPASPAVGLTAAGPGSAPGEPGKYYPKGTRTFVRVAPGDEPQAQAQLRLQRAMGCTRTFVLDDDEFDGYDAAATFQALAQAAGFPLVGSADYDPGAADYSSLALSVAQTVPDCVLLSALPQSRAALVTEQLAAALPRALFFATASLAEPSYVDPLAGGVPLDLDARLLITAPVLADSAAARALRSAYARDRGPVQPWAACGYAAMQLALVAIAHATHNGSQPARRSKVLGAIFASRDVDSPLGLYGIDHDGDTTLTRYGVYRLRGGRLELWTEIAGVRKENGGD